MRNGREQCRPKCVARGQANRGSGIGLEPTPFERDLHLCREGVRDVQIAINDLRTVDHQHLVPAERQLKRRRAGIRRNRMARNCDRLPPIARRAQNRN